jgi:FixJ family two-component response regulator
MTDAQPLVYLIDDDPRLVKALGRLLVAAGHRVEGYGSAEAFLQGHDPGASGCAIIDLGLPGMDGFELQASLAAGPVARPVIFLTGHGDIPSSVRAMKAGATDFLTKPVDAVELLAAVAGAIERDAAAREERARRDVLQRRFDSLTPREREVLEHVVAGRLNKQIAGDLGAAVKTVKVHRGRMMKKMGVTTVVDLVHLVSYLRAAAERPLGPDGT